MTNWTVSLKAPKAVREFLDWYVLQPSKHAHTLEIAAGVAVGGCVALLLALVHGAC